jgi:thiamine pyrophosphate-dependent acetolactate synthase large subunit-like protein
MLARAMRAEVFRVETPAQLAPALKAALASARLCVLDVECARDVPRYAVPLIRKLGTMPFPYTWSQGE